jgi:O-antigen ligase
LAGSLAIYFLLTRGVSARWWVLGAVVGSGVAFVFVLSGSPIATLLRLGGISAETGWYRQAIWEAAMPVVLGSPLFGIGLTDAWDWQASGALVGASVDALWLELAMSFGIPGSLLIFFTVIGAFWKGAVHGSPRLSPDERRLSLALGIITMITVFQGFTVHLWGTCWVLLGVFAGMRASLAEAAIVRERVAVSPSQRHRTVAGEGIRQAARGRSHQ